MSQYNRSINYVDPTSSGPFEATVVSHLDPAYMGTLLVELLKTNTAGNMRESTGQLVEARYLSPFYGVTPVSATSDNDGYTHSQKSYGFWAVPPDVGTRVVVILLEGKLNKAFWIGCVQDDAMNFMLPGYAATANTTDADGKKVPVAEYNKRLATTANNPNLDPTFRPKPAQSELVASLIAQGLLEDDHRGLTTSSARREVPSMVFGWSTPGPVDKRVGALRSPTGPAESKINTFVNRLGGSSFVMDDGDDKFLRKTTASEGPPEYANAEAGETDGNPTLPQNELVRIKTRTGHQILLHNTEDLIYISNARGTAWIELTSDGKIDIHANDSISIHTEADLNFVAERDINLEAGRNVNVKASAKWSDGKLYQDELESGRIQLESMFNTNIDAGANLAITTNQYVDNSQNDKKINGTYDLSVAGNSQTHVGRVAPEDPNEVQYMHQNIAGELRIGAAANMHIKTSSVAYYSAAETHIKSSADMFQAAANIHQLSSAAAFISAATVNINSSGAALLTAASGVEVNGGSAFTVTAGAVSLNGAGAGSAATASPAEPAQAPNVALKVSKLGTLELPRVLPSSLEATAYTSIVPRIPQHEPYLHHENLAPAEFKLTKTDREAKTSIPAAKYIRTTDTFNKGRSAQ